MLIGKSEGDRSVGRYGCKWEDNIGMELREIRYDGSDWIHLAEDRDPWWSPVNTLMNLRVS